MIPGRCRGYIGSLGTPQLGVPPAGTFAATNLFANSGGVYVKTRNPAGTDTDEPFDLAVLC